MAVTKIATGKSETLKIIYVGSGASERSDFTVTLTTNEPQSPEISIPVKAKVKKEFKLALATLNFDRMPKGESRTVETSITSVQSKPFKILNIISTREEFTFQWKTLTAPSPVSYQITATARGIRAGQIVEAAAIATDNSDEPIVPLYLNAEIDSDLRFAPAVASATLGEDRMAGVFGVEAERLSANGELKILGIEEGAGMKTTFTSTTIDARHCKLAIRIESPFTTPRLLGEFLIKTNVEDQPVHLPYRLMRSAPKAGNGP